MFNCVVHRHTDYATMLWDTFHSDGGTSAMECAILAYDPFQWSGESA